MEMVEVKVKKIIGAALEWSVVSAFKGLPDLFVDTERNKIEAYSIARLETDVKPYARSGLLIRKHKKYGFVAGYITEDAKHVLIGGRDLDPYVAIFRAIVSAKLDETVLVPKELVK